MKLGGNIKYLRKQNNITQESLAEHLGVSCQAVSKWETNVNAPDIYLLPQIAKFFGVSLDALFHENISSICSNFEEIKDDDVIRIVQMRGNQILKVKSDLKNNPTFEIAFPKNCNNTTQNFKVEVFGNVITDGSINGDVIVHQNLHCGSINSSSVCVNGNINVHEINSLGTVKCNNIIDCNHLNCKNIECSGNVSCNKIEK